MLHLAQHPVDDEAHSRHHPRHRGWEHVDGGRRGRGRAEVARCSDERSVQAIDPPLVQLVSRGGSGACKQTADLIEAGVEYVIGHLHPTDVLQPTT